MKYEGIKRGLRRCFYIFAIIANMIVLCVFPSALLANLSGEKIIYIIGGEKISLMLNTGIIILFLVGALGYFFVFVHFLCLEKSYEDVCSQLETMYAAYEQLYKRSMVVVIQKNDEIMKGIIENISNNGVLLKKDIEGDIIYIPFCNIRSLAMEKDEEKGRVGEQ